MGLTADQLRAGIDALAAGEPGFAAALARAGYPEPRLRDRGYATLLRTIVGQQVSVAAAASIWRKLEAQVGDLTRPEKIKIGSAACRERVCKYVKISGVAVSIKKKN